VNITEFLEARIAEDEKLAEAALSGMHGEHHDAWDYAGYVLGTDRDSTPKQDEFVTAWWPQRALAECAAKREVLALDDGDYMAVAVIKALAAVYKDHPDYQKEWSKQ
jgi:hypothetical protein